MSLRILLCVFFYIYMDTLNNVTVAFTSWQEPPIRTANGSGKASIFVPENHTVGTSTGIKLKVLGGTGNVTYSMSNNPYFSVDPNNGDVVLKSKLDYETSKSIDVIIGAKDESNPIPETCTANMTIIIADVDDNAQNSIASINDSTIILPVELKVNIPDNTHREIFIASVEAFPVSDSDKRNLGEIDVYSFVIPMPNVGNFPHGEGDELFVFVIHMPNFDGFDFFHQLKGEVLDMSNKFKESESWNKEFANRYLMFMFLFFNITGLNANNYAKNCNSKDLEQIFSKITPRLGFLNRQYVCNDTDSKPTEPNLLSAILVTDSCSGLTWVKNNGYITVATQRNSTHPSCQLLVSAEDSRTTLNAQVRIEVQFLECPKSTDYLGKPWKRGVPGTHMWRPCPDGIGSGRVTRFCDENGIYHDPVYNCTHPEIADIYNKIVPGPSQTKAIGSILDDLVNATNTGTNTNEVLLIGDIEAINEILSKITDVVQANSSDIQHVTDSFVEVVDNIIGDNMTNMWTVLMNQTGSGADVVIDNLDRFVEQIITAPDSNITHAVFAKTNLMLEINTNVSCERDIHFPNRTHDVVPTWTLDTIDSINVPCLQGYKHRPYSAVMYRDVSRIVPATFKRNKSESVINAPVMSFTFYPKFEGNLEEPVEITFQTYNIAFESPSCSFWTRNLSENGFWSDDGCWLHSYDKARGTVVCKCNHLTNFAVLMSPAATTTSKENSHHVTLSIITVTGCIISMVCLFLTVVIYVILWRTVKSVRSIIHMNLASVLFVAYLLFLTGVNQTEHKGVCTTIAVLLHLVYLLVFFIMLSEGLVLAYSVLKPLSTFKPGIPLLMAFYLLSVVIVGISMAAVQLDGYGNESFCWLSTHMGLIWAFIVPVLFVIVVRSKSFTLFRKELKKEFLKTLQAFYSFSEIVYVNSVIIYLVVRKMCGTVAMRRKRPKEKAKAGIRSIVVLMPIMGVTWVSGIFSVNEDAVIFQYLFAIFNSLQGLLVFIFHCVMDRKIKEGLKGMFRRRNKKSVLSSCLADTQSGNKRAQPTKDTYV